MLFMSPTSFIAGFVPNKGLCDITGLGQKEVKEMALLRRYFDGVSSGF